MAIPHPAPLDLGVWLATLLLALAMQFVRYRRHSGPAERQQALWLLLGFGTTLGLMIGTIATRIL